MKRYFSLVATAVLLLATMSGAQDLAKNDPTVFGKPVKGKPNTYKFNSKYIVEIEKRSDGQITSIYIGHKENASWKATLSPSEVADFYRKVNTIKDIGKPVYEAVLGFRYFEDVYENAHVRRWLTSAGDGHVSHINAIRVMLPYKIDGKVSRVNCAKPWVQIEIGGLGYYSFNEGVKAGDSGGFWVIGPTNHDAENCIGAFTLQKVSEIEN